MKELALRVAPAAVEPLLDRLLPLAPNGVGERPRGTEVELGFLNPSAELRSAVPGGMRVAWRDVPDDWRERRALAHRPVVVANRLSVRPAWAPPPGDGLLDVLLHEGGSFGTGAHPTTKACLELLATLPADGSLADLGCGTGVLAIAAAKLGWSPVAALDGDAAAVALARRNAAANGVEVSVAEGDLSAAVAPVAQTAVANVPIDVHALIAAGLSSATRTAVLSGFAPADASVALDAWGAAGLHEQARLARGGWIALVVARS